MDRLATCSRTGKDTRQRLKPLLVLLGVLSACSQDSKATYDSAKAEFRAGRFSAAAKIAQAGYDSCKDETRLERRWMFKLLLAEMELFRGKANGAAAFFSEKPPPKLQTLNPRYEMLRGYWLSRTKRYAEAQQVIEKAITEASASRDAETEADAWLYLGISKLSYGHLPAAELDFQRAQRLSEEKNLNYQKAAALTDRGLIQMRLEHFADAIPLLNAARELAARAGARLIGAMALNNIAACQESLGDLDSALEFQKLGVEELETFGVETSLSSGYSELGVIHQKRGETADAVRCFTKALQLVGKDAPAQYAFAASNLASVLEQTGSLDEADRFNRLAFAQGRESLTAGLALNEAAIAEHRGQREQAALAYGKAVESAQKNPSILWQAYAGLARLHSAQNDFRNADANYAKALEIIEASRADQLKSDYKISFLSSLIRFYQDYVALLLEHGDARRALEVADSSRASVLAEDLRAQDTRSPLIQRLQNAAKASRTVFLFYWLAPKASYLWAITGTQCKAVTLADQAQIKRDVDSYRALIERQKSDPLAGGSRAGASLYQELVAPIAGLLPKDGRVVIVPDGVLHNLNFETLLVPSPQPHYWIQDAVISVAPSLSVLRPSLSPRSARRSLLLMGDPVTQGTDFAPLPEAKTEIANVQRYFPAASSKVYAGGAAIVGAYAAAQPQTFSTIHFATHVDANSQTPLSSAIILSPHPPDGFRLYARDIAQIPLSADLVTISACRGAGARNLTGEGLVGFAWAFFQARAQNVVTSLWDVYDPSSAELMDNFYAAQAAGRPYADALRDAKLKLLPGKYKNPYYWAPFQLYSRTWTAR